MVDTRDIHQAPLLERIAELEAKNRELKQSSGSYCMCGDAMEGHGYTSGHSPVEATAYYFGVLEEDRDALRLEVERLNGVVEVGKELRNIIKVRALMLDEGPGHPLEVKILLNVVERFDKAAAGEG